MAKGDRQHYFTWLYKHQEMPARGNGGFQASSKQTT
jgi:hypothetical protein